MKTLLHVINTHREGEFSWHIPLPKEDSIVVVISDMSSNCVDVNSTSAPAVAEQLCYIPCNFCNIILAVSVPCSNLFDIVTVRCGHCGNLWSVNMAAALHSLSATWQHQQQQLRGVHHQQPQPQQPLPHPLQHHHHHQDLRLQVPSAMTATSYRLDLDLGATSSAAAARCNRLGGSTSMMRAPVGFNEQRAATSRPPEKKQRAPSAYNQFIKEEIQRIKANNPDISHREAFSTAAKNWAHFPHIQFGLMLENNNQLRLREGSDKTLTTKTTIFNK